MPELSANINNSFFDGAYKEVWRQLIPEGLTAAECEFIINEGRLEKGAKILDWMCGYGRHALELARKGIMVHALDNQEDYINEISRKALQEGLQIQAVAADITDAQLHPAYDAAICMGNSFAFFNRQQATTILKRIAASLKADGLLVINSWMIAEIAFKHFQPREWYDAGDYRCILEYKYLFHPSRIESVQTIIGPDGATEVLKGVDYIFSLDDLQSMFHQAGLQTTGLYSTPRKKAFAMGDTRIYIVAQKINEPG
jgi:SAM-dependent methyltransferase